MDETTQDLEMTISLPSEDATDTEVRAWYSGLSYDQQVAALRAADQKRRTLRRLTLETHETVQQIRATYRQRMRNWLEAGGTAISLLLTMHDEHDAHLMTLSPEAARGLEPYVRDALDEAEIEAERWNAAHAR